MQNSCQPYLSIATEVGGSQAQTIIRAHFKNRKHTQEQHPLSSDTAGTGRECQDPFGGRGGEGADRELQVFF